MSGETLSLRETIARMDVSLQFLIENAKEARQDRAEIANEQRSIRSDISALGASIAANSVRIGQLESKHSSLSSQVEFLGRKYHEQLGQEQIVESITRRITKALTSGKAMVMYLLGGGGAGAAWWQFWKD